MEKKEELSWLQDKIKEKVRNLQYMRKDLEKLEKRHTIIAVDSGWTGTEDIPELDKTRTRIMEFAHGIEIRKLDLEILKEKQRRLLQRN